MKKVTLLIILLLSVSVLLSSCGSASAYGSQTADKEKTYTTAELVVNFGNLPGPGTLGITPDGKYALIMNSDTEINVMNLMDQEVINTIETSSPITNRREAMWSDKGDSFILSDTMLSPEELISFRSFNFSVYTTDRKKGSQVTEENLDKSIVNGGEIIYSPSWSVDNKGILFSKMDDKGIKICSTDIKSGKNTVLYRDSDRSGAEQAIELKKGLLLCEHNGPKKGDNDIFLYDVNKDDEKSLEDIIDNEKKQGAYYEIKDWSKDRRTVLINKWVGGLNIEKCFIIKFNGNFSDYKVTAIEYQIKGMDGKLATSVKKNARIAYSDTMSPDGRYLVTCEDEVLDVKDSSVASFKRQLVLHDLVKNKEYTFYETDQPELIGMPFANAEPFFMTEDGIIYVLTQEGYQSYQLMKDED